MHEPVEELYFNWLCAKLLDNVELPNHKDLLKLLFQYEFVPMLQGDFNRAEDGLEVRQEFLNCTPYDAGSDWRHIGCSMLEMIVALSLKGSWLTSEPMRVWFWRIMQNLHLDEYRRVSADDIPDIEERLYAVVWRQYDDNGFGGMFPLRMTEHDQRQVEIWYQLCEYVEENQLI